MITKNTIALALACLLGAISFHSPAFAGGAPTYHATLLGGEIESVFPGVEFPSSDARALNENGDMAGEARLNGSQMQGWVYTVEHGVVALPLLPGWTSAAITDISERDENGEVLIVGGGVPGIFVDIVIGEAALWRYSTVTGEVLEVRNLGVPTGFEDSLAVAVSNDGTVAGFSGLTGAFTNWKYDVTSDVLETFDFPWRVADMNNLGQVVGGPYRGDLFGNYEDLGETYEPGDIMPSWAIKNGGISAGWHRINDLGWPVGRAGTGISDGAGHLLVAIVRFADDLGWVGMNPVSHLSLAGGINNHGDFTSRQGGIYLDNLGSQMPIDSLVAEEWDQLVSVSWSYEINDNRQIAGAQAHAFLLTPIGEMIIPGDVNGDVMVDLDDYCAWSNNPIDLNNDRNVDEDDEQWLRDRLAVFGFEVADCNANGMADHCEILEGTSNDCDGNGVPDECQDDCNGDGVPDTCDPDCNGNGVPDPCDIAAFTSLDCNENGIPDECDGGSVVDAVQAYDPPLQVLPNATASYDLVVTDTGIVDDVDFSIDILYRIGYLSVELSHNDTTITLIDRPGHPEVFLGNGQLGYDIILDDEGSGGPIEDEGNFGSPFEPITSPPSFTPNEPLSTFDGMPMEGVWTVTIITHDSSPTHEFNDWGLSITTTSVPVDICDCNDNGVDDADDIAEGDSDDANGNGVPDECEARPADMNGDGFVDSIDLLELLGAWGPCNQCPADLTGDGIVDVLDLLALLSDWG